MYDKKTLIVIIILLVVFVPLAFIGAFKHFGKNEDIIVDDNPNHEFIYNNKVYFYYNDELLGTYDCSNCTNVITTIDDIEYHTNYYKEGTDQFNPILSSTMAVFSEGDKITFYAIGSKKTVQYDAIKNYNVANSNNLLLVKRDNLWQIIQIDNNGVINVFDGSYDYVAIPNHIENNILNSDYLITKLGDNWQIFDVNNNTNVVNVDKEIIDFNEYYYITYDNTYQLFDYNNVEVFANITKNDIRILDNYVFLIRDDLLLIYENDSTNIFSNIALPVYQTIDFELNETSIDIMIDGNLYQSIALS